MGYFLNEELLMLIPGLLTGIPSSIWGIASYILSAMAIYAIARRRGLRKAWMAWVPVLNVWLLGSISDQYQYVVKGEYKSRRTWLLVLNVVKTVLTMTVVILAAVIAAGTIFRGPGMSMRPAVTGPVIGLLGVVMPLAAVSVACVVIRYMALYDVYRSLDPANSVLYLVLSILFNVTEPFFLFFNREKDLGMPPRKQASVPAEEPVYQQDQEYELVEDPEYP